MNCPSLLSTSRDEDVGGLDVQVQHLVLVDDAQPAQDLVEQRADGGFAQYLFAFQVARGDDEILHGVTLQVIHHHVDGFVLAEEIQHRDDARVRNLGERAPFFEETLEAQPVQRLLFRLHARNEFTRRTIGQGRRKIFLQGDKMTRFVFGEVHNAESASGDLLDDLIAADHGPRR